MNITERIKARRIEKGLTQTEVARQYGTSPEFYHRLENKGDKLTIEQAGKIASILGVTLPELMRGEAYSRSYARLEEERNLLEQKLEHTQQLLDAYKLTAEMAVLKLKSAI